jgi:hypothetical protein
MTSESAVSTTAAFRRDFDTVAEYYEMEKAGDLEAFRDITRERLRNDKDGTIVAEFATNAAWMSGQIHPPAEPGHTGPFLTGFEFCDK